MTQAAVTARPTSVWSESLRPLSVGLLLTITLAAFEALAVATAMPVVADEFGVALYGWVFSAFMLGDLLGIVVAGQLIDRGGLLPPYVLGLGLFATGLVIGGLAPNMLVLIAGRAIQGVGGGCTPPVAYVAIRREYPRELRPTMFAYFSTAWIVPGLIGPGIAGYVAEYLSWRFVFLGLLPLAVVALALTVRSLRTLVYTDDDAADAEASSVSSRSRILLAVGVVAGAGLVLAALSTQQLLLFAALAVAGLVLGLPALVRLLPPGTLRARRGLPATILIRGILTFGFTGAETFLPLALVSIRLMSPSIAGLTLTAATISWAIGSWIQARWFARVGARSLIGFGFAIVLIGILLEIPVLDRDVPVALAVVAWGVTGLGMGIAHPAISLSVLNLARLREQGAATAALQLSDVLGTALGAGVGGAIVALGASTGSDPAMTLFGVFALMAGVIAFGAAVTARVRGEVASAAAEPAP